MRAGLWEGCSRRTYKAGALIFIEAIAPALGGVGRVELRPLPTQRYRGLLPREQRGVRRVLSAFCRLLAKVDPGSGAADRCAGINLRLARPAGAANQCQAQ